MKRKKMSELGFVGLKHYKMKLFKGHSQKNPSILISHFYSENQKNPPILKSQIINKKQTNPLILKS